MNIKNPEPTDASLPRHQAHLILTNVGLYTEDDTNSFGLR